VLSLLTDRIDQRFLEACPALRVVSNLAVGFDNIDVAACSKRGIVVTNTPDVLTEATADLAFALLLSVARRLRACERLARSGDFGFWSPTALLGLELSDATLGIYGFGRIGRAIARRASGFGMNVVYCTRSEVPPPAREGASPVDFETLLSESDVVAISAPLNEATRRRFGAEEFAAMKRGALLLNTARGAIVDEAALVHALEAGAIGGAGLDVFEDEPRVHPGLLERDDVVLTPHVGSATTVTRVRMAELALANLDAVLHGRSPLHRVN
jgi:glyoxylate reductase